MLSSSKEATTYFITFTGTTLAVLTDVTSVVCRSKYEFWCSVVT